MSAFTLPTFLAAVELKDYEGGDNPIVLVILVSLVFAIAVTGLGYLLWEAYKVMKIHRICTRANLTNQEIGHVKSTLRQIHMPDPLAVATKRMRFDDFMNRVAHLYSGMSLTEENLIREIDTFQAVRQKLKLRHNFKTKQLASSRALPVKHPIQITYKDEDTGETFEFFTKVAQNNEFFLGIRPPEHEIAQQITEKRMVPFEITFGRERGILYTFETRFVQLISKPELMWYVEHSRDLYRIEQARQLDIPTQLLILDENSAAQDIEHADPKTISVLTNQQCVICSSSTPDNLSPGQGVLVSFELEGNSFTLRGMVSRIEPYKDQSFIHVSFHDLTRDEQQFLIRFNHEERKKRKKLSNKKKQGPQGKKSREKAKVEA